MALSVDDPGQAIEALSHVDPDRGLLLFSPIYWQTMARALHQRGQYVEELQVAREGVRRFPNELGPQIGLIRAFAALGRIEDLTEEMARPLAADPDAEFDASYRLLGAAAELRTHGHGREADRLLGSVRLPPVLSPVAGTHAEVDRIGADLLYEAGRWADARRRYAESFARHPTDLESLIGVGASAARVGDRTEAARVEQQLATWAGPFPLGRNTYGRARIAAVLGDSAPAVALLGQSFHEGYPVVSIWERHVHSDRDFAGWNSYAPFRTLMGLP
jgi:tetratricopeptide (TPR) repeat protein